VEAHRNHGETLGGPLERRAPVRDGMPLGSGKARVPAAGVTARPARGRRLDAGRLATSQTTAKSGHTQGAILCLFCGGALNGAFWCELLNMNLFLVT
jgi:hypothetical protein